MTKRILLLVLLAVLASPIRAADPLSGGIGARPVALGSAYAGFAEDAFSIFTNPSGLADTKERSFSNTYFQPLSLITFTSLSGVFPNMWGGTFALAYRNRTLSNMLVSQETADYTDQDLILCFAKKIRTDLALGGNYRIISKGLSKEVPGYESQNGSGGALDLGIKYLPRPWLKVGLSLQSLGGKVNNQDGSQSEIPAKTTIGISLKIGGDEAYFKNLQQKMHLNFDIGKIADEPNSRLHLGCEWWPVEAFALRLGFDQSPKSKTENYTHPTAGLGINYRGITFDYAFRKLTDPSELIEHYFSLGYAGQKEVKPPTPSAEITLYPTPEPIVLRKVKRVHFTDVPPGYWAKETIERLATAGAISGYADGTFRPKQKVTRNEFEKLLAAAKHLPPASISEPDKFVTRAEAAKKLGLSEKLVKPNDALTRAEFAEFLIKTPLGKAAVKRLPPLED